jgi:hypothetical protein
MKNASGMNVPVDRDRHHKEEKLNEAQQPAPPPRVMPPATMRVR